MPQLTKPMHQGFVVIREGESDFETACDFTRNQFSKRFGCELTHFYPIILTSWVDGELQAVVGVRSAAEQPLFLEQYLDAPIEDVIELKRQPGIPRGKIAELGGFAALDRNAALPLMRETANALLSMSFDWAVCTANKPIRGCLTKLGIPFQQLAVASPARLSDVDDNWGSYYASLPFVLAGEIGPGARAIESLFVGLGGVVQHD